MKTALLVAAVFSIILLADAPEIPPPEKPILIDTTVVLPDPDTKGHMTVEQALLNRRSRRDFTDVRDVVRALELLVARGRRGEAYNVCSGNVHRVSDLLDVILDLSDAQVEVHQDPDLMRPSDEPVIAGSNALLVRDTGWSPRVPIERTIADMMEFWRSRGV